MHDYAVNIYVPPEETLQIRPRQNCVEDEYPTEVN